jgi:mitosis inhibitor protein kinase SWE1
MSQSTNFLESSTPRTRLGSPQAPVPDLVYAVKKTRKSYAGSKDREQKLQEVNVLKQLGHIEHVIHLVDSWEAKNHLYIQTEFCEEGSLDVFLSQVGQKARLDDFRIWKILLELSLVSLIVPDFGILLIGVGRKTHPRLRISAS